jgi:catechol 2,3-dioxygenase-like lactoylglutathione lyase family enzyme
MLATCDVIAFVATRDAARARAFYEGALGLRLLADDPAALVFDAHGTMLRIAKVREFSPAPFTVLGWKVPDIRNAVTELQKSGAAFERYPGVDQDEFGIWKSPSGAQVAWFKDPDGNTLSLTQFKS